MINKLYDDYKDSTKDVIVIKKENKVPKVISQSFIKKSMKNNLDENNTEFERFGRIMINIINEK